MQWKEPKNSQKYYWTEHAKKKMRQHGLSAQRVTRVLRRPLRTEKSIAGESVIAVMQPQSMKRDNDGGRTWSSEIWVMYKIVENKKRSSVEKNSDDAMAEFLASVALEQKQIRIISAWRYPGKTKPGQDLPDEIVAEIAEVM
jgi:hypothetical protein